MTMAKFNFNHTRAVQSLLLAGLLSLAAAPAVAGECPADKVGANSLPGAATAPVGVTEAELTSIDLSKESVSLSQRRLRYRHMEIAPGGVVPLHDHSDRPALIMVNQGKIFEYSSKCTVPILHRAGEIARESNGLKHWWKNEGNETVILTIADIVNDKKPDTMAQHM
jgi:quercetin dioxygenase-like cupin family protein